jgi:hypothetical protein
LAERQVFQRFCESIDRTGEFASHIHDACSQEDAPPADGDVAEKVTATVEEAGEALASQLLVQGGKFRQPSCAYIFGDGVHLAIRCFPLPRFVSSGDESTITLKVCRL